MSLVPPRPSPIAAGYRLDRYELICPIAEGGMASVWIARQTGKHGFQRLVAVKTILPKYASEPKFQRMFVDEARIASRIEHTNVTHIVDVGEQHDVTYLVMEYVDGDALSKISRAAQSRNESLPLGMVLRVMADVCGGLHAAHELKDEDGAWLGVVHRDVSPQNVLVTTRGVAKLIDFGIAKARDRLSGETHGDTLKGKVQYMPPEQALGLPVDRRADVWAVGAVLYHLITGKAPFEADNEVQTLFRLSSGKPPAPLPPDTPSCVRDIVKRALSHSAEDRYGTAAELQQALESAIVECQLAGSTSAVAAFLAEIVGDRAEKRKAAIALGLKAAEERDKVAEIMRSNAEATGAADTGQRVITALTQADVLRRPDSLPAPESTTSPTGHTLGSAAMALPMLPRHRGRTVAVAAGVLSLVAVVALLAMRSSHPALPAAAANPAPLVATSGPPAIPPPPPAEPVPPPTAAPVVSTTPAATPPAARPAAPARWTGPAAVPASTGRPAPAGKKRENYGF